MRFSIKSSSKYRNAPNVLRHLVTVLQLTSCKLLVFTYNTTTPSMRNYRNISRCLFQGCDRSHDTEKPQKHIETQSQGNCFWLDNKTIVSALKDERLEEQSNFLSIFGKVINTLDCSRCRYFDCFISIYEVSPSCRVPPGAPLVQKHFSLSVSLHQLCRDRLRPQQPPCSCPPE